MFSRDQDHLIERTSEPPDPEPQSEYDRLNTELDELSSQLIEVYCFTRPSNHEELGVEALLDAVRKPIAECVKRMQEMKREAKR